MLQAALGEMPAEGPLKYPRQRCQMQWLRGGLGMSLAWAAPWAAGVMGHLKLSDWPEGLPRAGGRDVQASWLPERLKHLPADLYEPAWMRAVLYVFLQEGPRMGHVSGWVPDERRGV